METTENSFAGWISMGDHAAGSCANGVCTLPDNAPEHPLFRPLVLGSLALSNRFVMAPMGRERSPGGVPGHEMADHYRQRVANGGAGLVITEATYIDHPSAGEKTSVPRLAPGAEAGFTAMTEAVHAAGGKIFVQLFHQGANDDGRVNPELAYSPSGISAVRGSYGKAMTLDDIDSVVAAYARAAVYAKSVGFDGVEVHGAHGYLIDQFLWAHTNRRSDAYGGGARSRARFAAQIVAAIRQATAPSFPISFRLSQWKVGVRNAAIVTSPHDLEELLGPIVQAGATLLHASDAHFDRPAFAGSDRSLAVWVKELTELPTIAVGSVGLEPTGLPSSEPDLRRLTERIEQEEFDLVAVGRRLLVDAAWVSRLARNPASVVATSPMVVESPAACVSR